jgi:hypothetical protein
VVRRLSHPKVLQLFADLGLHDAIPFLFPLYWLVFLPKGSLRWIDPTWWLVYPVLYFLYSMCEVPLLVFILIHSSMLRSSAMYRSL